VPKVNFIRSDGGCETVSASVGDTVMRAAVDNDVAGIIGDCGGEMSCGTCHVYVGTDWVRQLPGPDDNERDLLEGAIDPSPTSRLSCQIVLVDDLDGLEIHIPASQL
jgi:ferredoxin, 2Fe-2S